MSQFLSGSQSGQLKCLWVSIRLCFSVRKASRFFSTANKPNNPALCRPRLIPPHPANKSTYLTVIAIFYLITNTNSKNDFYIFVAKHQQNSPSANKTGNANLEVVCKSIRGISL